MWRPKGWRIPYNRSKNRSIHETIKLRHAYEAGADAMVKALRAKGYHTKTQNNTVVSIPDDE